MDKVRKLLDKLIHCLELAGGVCLIAMVLMVFFNAVSRYVFSYGFNQTEELSRFAFVWLVFLGAVVVYYRHDHVVIPLLADHLKGKAKIVVSVLAQLIVTGVFIFFLYSALLYTQNTLGVLTSGARVHFSLVTMAGVVMASLILLVDLVNFADFLRRQFGGASGDVKAE
ncbi:MAG: TRAP transporter small permease [Gracilibacteraceae bacterium]|jgi:TRAP-type C4-dicarboxylate transport system permease small subunit|nr:TRAP transporter small permease [Gracilibacteraceae bacterium]